MSSACALTTGSTDTQAGHPRWEQAVSPTLGRRGPSVLTSPADPLAPQGLQFKREVAASYPIFWPDLVTLLLGLLFPEDNQDLRALKGLGQESACDQEGPDSSWLFKEDLHGTEAYSRHGLSG